MFSDPNFASNFRSVFPTPMEEDYAPRIDQKQNAQVLPPIRRPRVREVSSRFMSPVVPSELRHSNARSPLPKLEHKSHTPTAAEVQSRQGSTSSRRRRLELEVEPLRRSDENRLPNAIETLETPFSIEGLGSQSKSNAFSNSVSMFTNLQRKQRDVKPSKENGGRGGDLHRIADASSSRSTKNISRADTPSLTSLGWTMASSSRSRNLQQRLGNGTVTDATKLLQSSLPAPSNIPPSQETTSNPADSDDNLESVYNARSVPDIRSSMPETDMLPTVSGRLAEKYCNRNIMSAESDSFQLSTTRSLNLPLSSCDSSLFNLTSTLSRSHSNSINMGSLRLPPAPPCAKLGTDTRKGRKASVYQEDLHSLKMLHNRHLQWRFANAKAEASLLSQRREIERTFYSVDVAISVMYDSLKRKERELGLLKRKKTLSTILDAQIPLLDAWSSLEEDYTLSLSEATGALLNSSLQLPISGNVKVDTKEVGVALNSAGKAMETIIFHLLGFLTKAEETENCISELAKVTGGERVLIEGCEELLSKTYRLQVEECSLKGHLIQLNNKKNLRTEARETDH